MTTTIALLFLFLSGAGGYADGDFDRLKTLAGEWEATSSYGKSPVSFQLTSNGTALIESSGNGTETMVTLYHMDGDAAMMTHYCSVGNQPRMRAQKSSDPKSITFQFVDVANLKNRADGHMTGLVIKFNDADNVIEEWTWMEKGKAETTAFQLRRVKK